MKRLKKDRVKRGRIVLSAILTIALAILSLGFGGYLGYVTLNINYLTIGTMTGEVGGLLVVSDFFIFFGVIGAGIAMKEIFIAHRNEEKFSAYKGALYSAVAFYIVIALISVVGVIASFVSFVPSNFTWAIVGLCILSMVLSAGCFYLVLRELQDHKKNMKKRSGESQFVNMDLSADEIRKFAVMKEFSGAKDDLTGDINVKHSTEKQNKSEDADLALAKAILQLNKYHENNGEKENKILRTQASKEEQIDLTSLNFEELAINLMQLEELRKAGLINDQEYQTLKHRCIT